jgi:hypothetical protein
MVIREKKIEYQRGLRQGDPLSPMLFILVMDVLGFMINKAVEEDLLQPLAMRIGFLFMQMMWSFF